MFNVCYKKETECILEVKLIPLVCTGRRSHMWKTQGFFLKIWKTVYCEETSLGNVGLCL